MRQLKAFVFSGALVLFVACGGDPVQGPTESGEAPLLDFAPIAGTWEGEWSNPNEEGEIEISLSASARVGAPVGTVDWFRPTGAFICSHDWFAVSAQPPMYTVDAVPENEGTPCGEGTFFLEHDPEAETLGFTFDFGSGTDTGTLTRAN